MIKQIILISILISCSFTGKLYSQLVVGQEAPHFSGVKIIDNQPPNLGNEFLFLDFWATWCSPCRKSLPHLDTLANRYKNKIIFIAVSDEKENEVRKFLSKNKFDNLIFGLDIEKDLFTKFEIKDIPCYYMISPQNTILASGYSSELSDSYLDSIISQYHSPKSGFISNIKISRDSLEKISSIEIYEKPGAKRSLSQSGYTLVFRDSLNTVLPYLTGATVFNRMRLQNLPHKMIELKVFSRNTPFDSLKMVAHDQIMASFGITRKIITERMAVYNFQIINSALLKNKNTFVETGVASKRDMVNDSTMRFDNYSLKDMVSYLERAYFPRIFYASTSSAVEFDWDLPIVNHITHAFVSFDRLREILSKDYGVEINESQNDEKITVYN